MKFSGTISSFFTVSLIILLAGACSQNDGLPDSIINNTEKPEWLVDTAKMTGTTARDVFPLVTNLVYAPANDAPKKGLKDKAIVFQIDDTVLVFPYWMMGAEIVNGHLNDTHFAVSYCPKTKTTYVFNRQIEGEVHTFKASGVLYQDNLVFYDLETSSFWSQMYFKCIHGAHVRKEPELIHSFETTYGNALEQFPDALVFVGYPGEKAAFQSHHETSYESGNMVLGLLSHTSKPNELSVMNYDLLNDKGLIKLENLMVIYNKKFSYIDAFFKPPALSFEPTGDFPEILTDNEGNTWNAFGVATSGPRKGDRLNGATSYLGYWWAWKGIFESFNHLN
ncbi:MAG: DUF3179 domain-containing (seleno)protein [Bacteroidota bacterium]